MQFPFSWRSSLIFLVGLLLLSGAFGWRFFSIPAPLRSGTELLWHVVPYVLLLLLLAVFMRPNKGHDSHD